MLDDETGAVWCWMGETGAVWSWIKRQVQCGAGAGDRCSVVLDGETGAVWCWMMRQVQCGAG